MDTVLTTKLLDMTTQVVGPVSQRESEEGGNCSGGSNTARRSDRQQPGMNSMSKFSIGNQEPKKRVIFFSAFLACLSFGIIICNSFMSFVNDLFRDEAFLNLVDTYFSVHNFTKYHMKEKEE